MSSGRIARRLPPARRELRAVADDELLAAQIGDVVLRHVVAERPHQLRHRHLGAGRHAAVARRIELQEPALAPGVLDVKPGVTPSLFDDVTVQVPGAGPSVVSGPLRRPPASAAAARRDW